MNDIWTDRLSEYLDGELSAEERRELEAHLAECPECSATLDELRRVVARAAVLEDQPPTTDLWPGIAERIGVSSGEAPAALTDLDEYRDRKRAGLGRRRFAFTLPQLAAASVALVVLSGGTAWLMSRAARPTESEPPAAEAPAAPVPASFVSTEYDAAIVELEQILAANRDQLDTATVRVIEENLMIIDRAIGQAQRALAQDPASTYLHEHLVGTMRQKLEFLRQAAEMTGAVS
ncbi:MAG: hypothetical protein GWN99_18145 [Gemmatimonadetes bacterium]|uniref:Putative zinc-finger domain-containing protein n=1 Tax=Candidatus Kutchimonas denitrificans TaxID=3056748 RepID=A0AAE5CB11_9BACT|nr:hypothetical protein [Gemmatimonadota bacterium]NIR73968.1 hypothetical protein [Candidatus Kutchimonas denitrificans]NIS02957.1 hypothetical protein [Gemmatimonadota bacterium]NIT68674.1 hypothetical protein [Gemmatimonadota bacterium]NIU53255.1 hypothetical protein [Gemmatimonadota bacterium]